MRSKFSIFGHPLHPLLVALPIGLFVWTFVADMAYLATDKDKVWYDISEYTGIAAVVAALVAALPGFGDYFTIGLKSKAAVMATAHMLLNLSVVTLFAMAFVIQLYDGALSGTDLTVVIALHTVGIVLLSAAGVLGGEMVYRHHLAVVPHPEQAAEEERRHVEHVGV
jgi:uncharacterized membrane protein